MTAKQLGISVASLIITLVAIAGLFVWRSQLTPYERCLSSSCREREHLVLERARDAELDENVRLGEEKAAASQARYEEGKRKLDQLDRDIADVIRRGP